VILPSSLLPMLLLVLVRVVLLPLWFACVVELVMVGAGGANAVVLSVLAALVMQIVLRLKSRVQHEI